MITVKGSAESTLVIKKSRFLGYACRISSEQDTQDRLAQRKKQHYDAAHNCFAYILANGAMRYSDDGEPQGTAGQPMLDVIKKAGLSDVMVVCTRYFGGTLLGAGGLLRAYTRSAADTLDAAKKIELVPCSVYSCAFSYSTWAKAENLLSSYTIEEIQYSNDVVVKIGVTGGSEGSFIDLVASISLGQTVPVPLGQKLTEHEI
ncbi:MAG: IMPACT family protein [Eubacteriales bacterium]|nr:IMPACT family protein [Eubacteriales bacterium]